MEEQELAKLDLFMEEQEQAKLDPFMEEQERAKLDPFMESNERARKWHTRVTSPKSQFLKMIRTKTKK